MTHHLFFLLPIFIALPVASPPAAPDLPLAAARLAGTGLPYKYGANRPEDGGFDCSGFVQFVYKDVYGIKLPAEAGLQLEYLRKHGRVWDATTGWNPSDLRPGDLIFWTGTAPTRRRSPVTHVMIYEGGNTMVGSQNAGRRLNSSHSGVGFYRFYPSPPEGGSMPDDRFFSSQMRVYAYGRLRP
jgi:cell wall-associated NlpC family hydrolase